MTVKRNEWMDISDEKSRTYTWVRRNTHCLTIDHPKRLMVSDDGSHRVDNGGPTSYYVKPTWDTLTWEGKFLF